MKTMSIISVIFLIAGVFFIYDGFVSTRGWDTLLGVFLVNQSLFWLVVLNEIYKLKTNTK